MAQFDLLILNVDHPSETLEKGDIIQIERSGFFRNGGYRKDIFAVVTMEMGNKTLREVKRQYAIPLYEENGLVVIAKKQRKSKIEIDSIALDADQKADFEDIASFNLYLTTKTLEVFNGRAS